MHKPHMTMAFQPLFSKMRKDSEPSLERAEEEAFLKDEQIEIVQIENPTNRWKICSLILSLISSFLLILVLTQPFARYGGSFPTDLPDARRAIEYEEISYTGALVYDPENKRAVRLKDAKVEYFGRPTPELEAAWHGMLKGARQ